MKWLPVRLNPGPVEMPPVPSWTPLRIGLMSAWAAALVALAAVGLGGWSLISLSERRVRFVSAVTHELRTPLTTLRLYLDMLTGGMVTEPAQQTEYLQTLHGETERPNRLVANVLDFSRLERQRPRLDKTTVPVAALVEQVRSDWEERCKSAEKELIAENALPEGATVHTDVKLVEQVLGNLVDNACKYSRGAADTRIWLRSRQERGRLVLEVEDRGPGVAPGERRSIFRPFRRGVGVETAGGVGLGLALAREWASLLGGSLSVSPGANGTGARFRLELPV
jgi:signal transduction histidine kinase